MPTSRLGSGVAVVNERIYVIGGYDEAAKNESYDPANNQWSTHADIPTPRAHLSCSAFDGRIYCFGGEDWPMSDLAVTEMYDPATDKWSSQAAMPTSRSGHSAIAAAGGIFVIGGSDRNDVYDPVTNTWASRAPMLSARQYLATVVLNGKIHALGGGHWIPTNCQEQCNSLYECDENMWVTSSTMEIYDPAADQWTAKKMPGPRMGFGSAVLNRKVYLMGGVEYYPNNPWGSPYDPLDAADEHASNSEAYYLFVKD